MRLMYSSDQECIKLIYQYSSKLANMADNPRVRVKIVIFCGIFMTSLLKRKSKNYYLHASYLNKETEANAK